jgi:hypothetical protein
MIDYPPRFTSANSQLHEEKGAKPELPIYDVVTCNKEVV